MSVQKMYSITFRKPDGNIKIIIGAKKKHDSTDIDPYISSTIDSKVDTAINDALTSAVMYKGSVKTENDLPKENLKLGDMYNIESESSYGYEGINVAWNGSSLDPMGYTFNAENTTTDTKVKGAAETEYHTGNVNITLANIGITIT